MHKSATPSTTLGMLTVVLTLLGWSSVPLFLRHFSERHIDGWTSNGWRYGFSALVWAPVLVYAAWRGRSSQSNSVGGGNRGLPNGLWRAAVVPSIVNATGQVCFTWAFYFVQPALVTFGLRTQLIFVAVGAWILFPRERVIIRAPGYLLGAIVLLLGTTCVLLLDEPEAGEATVNITAASAHATTVSHAIGITLAIVSGLLFACYGLAVRKYMEGVNSVIAFAAICQYTALAMVILMLLLGNNAGMEVLRLPGDQIIMLLASALIGIAIGHVFYYFSIARLGVAITAGVLQLQPFIVAIGAMHFFQEWLNSAQWISGCVAVGGALMMLAVQRKISKTSRSIEEPVAIAEGESGA